MKQTTTRTDTTPVRTVVDLLTSPRTLALLPFAIALAALVLRLQGLDWDGGNYYHPDERSIFFRADCMYQALTEAPGWDGTFCQPPEFPVDTPGLPSPSTFFDASTSPLNPHWFPIGSIIVYALVAVKGMLEPFMSVGLRDLAAAGRTITAIADTGTVLMLFYLGRRVFDRRVGLVASALGAVAVLNIQLAHFYRPEPFVILLALATAWWLLNVLERGRRRDHVLLGLVLGLSFAIRASSFVLLAPLALTYGLLLWRRWSEAGRPMGRGALTALRSVVLAGLPGAIVAVVTFAVLQPYALLDLTRFTGDLLWEAGKSAGEVPYTVQYIGIPRNGLYELRQSAVWALGLPLGIIAWAGLGLTLLRAIKRPRPRAWLMLAFVLPLLFTAITYEVKFLRYIAPVLPFMIILGSAWLLLLHRWARRRSVLLGRALTGALVLVIAATAFYALAFAGIYRTDHPGVQAVDWINENAPPGSIVLADKHWDEGFPGLRVQQIELPMYEPDTTEKVARLSQRLADADYIVAYSNRPWGSIVRVPERYPYSSRYYRSLFNGDLGYVLEQGFARYPSFLGVSFVHDPFTLAGIPRPEEIPGVDDGILTLNLGWADENVANYDHPLVLLWRNEGRLDEGAIANLLSDGIFPEASMLTAEAAAQQRGGGTWTDIFSEGGLNGAAPWLMWLLAIELIYLATLPLAVRALRWLPDRGVVFARPLGLLLVAWLVWLGASVGAWEFDRASVLAALAIVAAASGVLVWRDPWLLTQAKRQWRYLAGVELLFLVAFGVFVLIRAANPDLWHPWTGGEKPMDLTYLTAVVKSTSFPPYDPWYAGGLINYYYFGFVLVASLVRLTGIVPEVAYNLAVPLFFALTLTAAFSVGFNLADSLRQRSRLLVRPRTAVFAGLIVALLATVFANLDGAAQLIQGAGRTLGTGEFGQFDFWRSSRVAVWAEEYAVINEFPFWTFLFADLHAHMLAMPFQLVAVGLALNVILSARTPVSLVRRWPGIGLLAFVVGSFAAINTWDVPAYAILSVGALTILAVLRHRGPLRSIDLARWALLIAVFWAVLYAAWLPFHQSYEAPSGSFKLSGWQTVFWHYLGIHGLLLFLSMSWLVVQARRHLSRGTRAPKQLATRLTERWMTVALGIAAAALALAVWVRFEILHRWTTVAFLGALLAVALALLARWGLARRDPAAGVHGLMAGMLIVALGIGAGVDLITAPNDIDRMNTVFKFSLNAWFLFSIVGGVGLWHLWASGSLRWAGSRLVRTGRASWVALLVLLVLASGVYPILGTRDRISERFDNTLGLTLDGTAYQRVAVYGDPGPTRDVEDDRVYTLGADAEAIAYLRANVEGSPVMLEAVSEHAYRWYPRTAKYAGVQVVVGWQWHQMQQRGDGGKQSRFVIARVRDVKEMYDTPDTARFLELAERYAVSFVYVGPTERTYFDETGLAKFESMPRLEVFFQNQEVTVYRVNGPAAVARSDAP